MLLRLVGTGLLCIVAWSTAAHAQTPDTPTPEPLPTSDQITASIQEVDAATDLDDAKKASAKQLYQQAAAALDVLGKSSEDAARFEGMISNAALDLTAVTKELNQLPKQPPSLESSLTLPQLQQQLATAEAEVLRGRDNLPDSLAKYPPGKFDNEKFLSNSKQPESNLPMSPSN